MRDEAMPRAADPLLIALSKNVYSYLGGIVAADWFRLLRDNQFAIDPVYWPRAAVLTVVSVLNSLIRAHEDRCYRAQLAQTVIEPPLFILGHWRSGTTFLHELLATDRRFAYPDFYEVLFPHTFLSTYDLGSRLLSFLLPQQRLMDKVEEGVHGPHEDEFGLCTSTLLSEVLSMVFPKRADHYDRYMSLRDVDAGELAAWRAGFVRLLKKLTWKHARPLVLKSPPHTCRIKLLLDLFPHARFVHIHRHPYAVFQSTRHLYERAGTAFHLQTPDMRDLEDRILRRYRVMYDIYFDEVQQIPPGQFHDLSYEALVRDPCSEMEMLYDRLGLHEFAQVRQPLQQFLRARANYTKNHYGDLLPAVRTRIAVEWQQSFSTWHYEA
jgi:hypothetical protein